MDGHFWEINMVKELKYERESRKEFQLFMSYIPRQKKESGQVRVVPVRSNMGHRSSIVDRPGRASLEGCFYYLGLVSRRILRIVLSGHNFVTLLTEATEE